MKYLLPVIFGFLLVATGLFTSQSTLHAQSATANSGEAKATVESKSDPYRSQLFRVTGTPDLQVNIPVGGIEVYPNPEIDGVKVDLYVKRGFSLWSGTRSLEDYRIIMQQRGHQIIASVEDKRPGKSAGGGNIEFNFVIQVPEELTSNLRTLSGEITVDGLKGKHYLQNQAGNVSVKNSNGDIRVVTTTGNVSLENLTGNIYAKTVSGHIGVLDNEGEIRLRSVSGMINAENISGTLVSASTSGNIMANFTEVAVGIYMETISGNINLAVPPTAGYRIEGKAMRFNFDELDEASITSRNIRSREATVVVREGDLPVKLSTISGRVTVWESNE